jgi:Protein of unknown function (DUF2892)
MDIINFLGSTKGRWTRGIVGVILIVTGLVLGGWWLLLSAMGSIFFLAGVLDFCPLGPVKGCSMRGKTFREQTGMK